MSSSQPPTNNHPNKNEHGGPRPQGADPADNVRYLHAVAGNARPHVGPPAQSRRDKLSEAVGMLGRALFDAFVLLTRIMIVCVAFVVAVYIVVALLFTYRAHNHSGHTRGAGSALTATKPTAAERAVSAAVVPAAFHTPTTTPAASDRPGVGRSLVTATRATAGRDDCRTERRGGRDRAVIGAGPIEIAIDTRVADCADRARSRDSADRDDRDCPCDRDRDRSGRERSRYRDQDRDRDRDPVVYLPADPYSYPGRAYPRDAYPGGYYPREGYRGDDGPGDRPGHVCRRVRPGEHPDLPDGGLICLPADRAPRGW